MNDATTNGADSRQWWQKPFRMVQTNLRMTDAALDPDALAQQTVDLGCDVLLFNIGGIFAFYPTELELHARNPLLDRDLLGDMIEAAHAKGLKLVGRFDMSKATRIAYERHPDWFVHNREGKPLEYNGTYQACVNGGWYQDYAPKIIAEALGKYPVDGIFFNMFGYRSTDYSGRYFGICVCGNCRRRFGEMYGKDLPLKEDFSDPSYRDYLEFMDVTTLELGDKMYAAIKKARPETAVMGQRTRNDLIRMEVQRAVDRPAPEWPHQSGEQARWAAAYGKGKIFASASANFIDFAWRFVAETGACHILRFAQQIANGAVLDYYLLGVIDQDDKKPLGAVRDLFRWYGKNVEHYAGLRSVARTGLYQSRKTGVYGRAVASAKYLQGSFRGTYRALLDSRVPFDYVIDEQAGETDFAETLRRYDTIYLPSVACMSDAEAAALDRFVEEGGTLVATGETGFYDQQGRPRAVNALASLPVANVTLLRPDMRGAYFRMGEGENAHVPDSSLMYLDGLYLTPRLVEGATTSMTLLPPQRFGPPELCYPEVESDLPGVVGRSYGKGRAVFLPWLPDWLYQRDSLPDFRHLLVSLGGGQAPVKLLGKGRVELTMSRAGADGHFMVHVVNYTGQSHNLYDEPADIHELRLGLRASGVGAARALVAGQALAVSPADGDGFVWVDLPPVGAFEAIRFEAVSR